MGAVSKTSQFELFVYIKCVTIKLVKTNYIAKKGKCMRERIKPTISGSAETMLQSFYARAQYSKNKHNKFYDAKAVELVDKIDYDFSTAAKDSTMGKGVIARTVVFDELVKNFIEKILIVRWLILPVDWIRDFIAWIMVNLLGIIWICQKR